MKIPNTIANFETTIGGSGLSSGDDSFEVVSMNTIGHGVAPNGWYGLTINEGQSNEEHIIAEKTGATTFSNVIRDVSRLDGKTSQTNGYDHEVGSQVKATDYPILQFIAGLLNGTIELDPETPLKYASEQDLSSLEDNDNFLATMKQVKERLGTGDDATLTGDLAFEGTNTHSGQNTFNGATFFGENIDLTGNEILNVSKITGLDTPDGLDSSAAANVGFVQELTLTNVTRATQAVRGVVRFATDAQVSTGTDYEGADPLVASPSQVKNAGLKYNALKTYEQNDIVNYGGKLYKALQDDIINIQPDFVKYSQNLDTLTQNGYALSDSLTGGDIYGAKFGDSGNYLYTMAGNRYLRRFPLATPYDISSATTHDQEFDSYSVDTQIRDLAFKSDGTKLYAVGVSSDAIYEFELGTAWDISGLTTPDYTYSFTIYAPNTYGMFMSPDDLKLFTCDYSSNEISTFTFGTAGDLSTLQFDGQKFYTGGIESTEYGICMSDDGTKLYFAGASGDNIYQCTLTTPYDISTMSYDNIAFSISSESSNIYGMDMSKDGTKLYTVDSTDTMRQYTLSTPFAINTASYDSIAVSLSAQDSTPRDLCISDDGTRIFVVGVTNDRIYQYNLGTPFALNTASYASKFLSISSEEGNAYAIDIAKDGSAIFIIGNGKTIYKYNLPTPNDLTGASLDSNSGAISDLGTAVGICVENGGDTVMILDQSDNYIYQLNLDTSYEIDSYTTQWGGYNFGMANLENIAFDEDGDRFYVSNNSTSRLYHLATPYDLDSAILEYFTRPTTGDAWTATTSEPTKSFSSSSQEAAFEWKSPYDGVQVKKMNFTFTRGSGSSGGTNYGNITMRMYEIDEVTGLPEATPFASGSQEVNTWNSQSPNNKYTIEFDTPLDVDMDTRYFISYQYDTTDSDTMTLANEELILESSGGIEVQGFPVVTTENIGNVNPVLVAPDTQIVYATNTSGILQYEPDLIPSIYWAGLNPNYRGVELVSIFPTYADTAGEFVCPSDGFIFGQFRDISHGAVLYSDGKTIASTAEDVYFTIAIPVSAGEVITCNGGGDSSADYQLYGRFSQ